MNLAGEPSPKEFGEALRRARESASVSLETIAERTKISMRVLESFENGELSRLPGGIFPRLFLRQILEILNEEPEPWLRAFDLAAGRAHSAERPLPPALHPDPVKGRRVGPWLVGLAVVAGAIAAVVLLERGGGRREVADTAPTPEAALSVLPPTPTPEPQPEPEVLPAASAVDSSVLVVRALDRPCWVQLRVDGGANQSRLVEAGQAWEVAAGGRPVELMLGDAGAVEVSYLGKTHRDIGRPGEVKRLRLAPDA